MTDRPVAFAAMADKKHEAVDVVYIDQGLFAKKEIFLLYLNKLWVLL